LWVISKHGNINECGYNNCKGGSVYRPRKGPTKREIENRTSKNKKTNAGIIGSQGDICSV
jgi:hypothetical protein